MRKMRKMRLRCFGGVQSLVMSKPLRITIDFTKHPQVFQRIVKSAKQENRSLAKQLLHEVLPIFTKPTKP